MSAVPTRRVLAFAWRHWCRHPRLMLGLGVLLLLATLAEVSGPIMIGRLIDGLSTDAFDAVLTALLVYLALRAAYQISNAAGDYLFCSLALRVMRGIGAEAFARVQHYAAEWHANTFAGKTVRNITRGIWAFDDFGDAVYMNLLPTLCVVLGVILVMAWTWPLMGLLFAVGSALYIGLSVVLNARYVAPLRRQAVALDSELSGALADAITCNAVVKSAGAEPREEARLAGLLDQWRAKMRRTWHASVDTYVSVSVLMLLLTGALLGTSVWLWQAGQASAGDVAYVLTSLLLVDGYLRDVGQNIRMAQQAINDLEDVVRYADTPPEIVDQPQAQALSVRTGSIAFESVTFAYRGQNRPVFDSLDLTIAPGERIALVGHSGSGKTTLTKLVQRLYELDDGRILIDGQDIAKVTQQSLRRNLALVPQEPVLFHRSLAENIAYARPEADQAMVERAAELAHAHAFIGSLPQGYATLVGERGVKLSGGERQRVAIARAILADRPLLILDEATSSLDSLAERLIQEALERLMAGRTTLIIAHRLSTIRAADRILVFEAGRIVEQGRHEALLHIPNGHYRQLYDLQAGGFVAEPPRLAG